MDVAMIFPCVSEFSDCTLLRLNLECVVLIRNIWQVYLPNYTTSQGMSSDYIALDKQATQ